VAVPVAAATITVADCVAEPPAPVHASVYLVVVVSAAVFCEPLRAWCPKVLVAERQWISLAARNEESRKRHPAPQRTGAP
jgi:hypothetical protein